MPICAILRGKLNVNSQKNRDHTRINKWKNLSGCFLFLNDVVVVVADNDGYLVLLKDPLSL